MTWVTASALLIGGMIAFLLICLGTIAHQEKRIA